MTKVLALQTTEGAVDNEWAEPTAGGEAFPVGSVFLAVVDTNPNTLLGYGTWSQIAQGQFLVGQKTADGDFDVAEETGGAKTHTHAGHATHVFTQPSDHAALTHAGATVNDHAAGVTGAHSGSAAKIGTSTAAAAPSPHTHSTPALVHTIGQANQHAAMSHSNGAVDAHSAHDSPNHVPPYFVVYVWKRTV